MSEETEAQKSDLTEDIELVSELGTQDLRSQAPVSHTCNPAPQKVEIRKMEAQRQSRQIVHETLSRKYPTEKQG
jgi:hypothetical protein